MGHGNGLGIGAIHPGGAVAIGMAVIPVTQLRNAMQVFVALSHGHVLVVLQLFGNFVNLALLIVDLRLKVAQLASLLLDKLFLLAANLFGALKRFQDLLVVDLQHLVLLVQLVTLTQVNLMPLDLKLEMAIPLLKELDPFALSVAKFGLRIGILPSTTVTSLPLLLLQGHVVFSWSLDISFGPSVIFSLSLRWVLLESLFKLNFSTAQWIIHRVVLFVFNTHGFAINIVSAPGVVDLVRVGAALE